MLTSHQQKVISLLPIVPAVLSVIASATIIKLTINSGFKTPYRRILFGLSLADIITSISFALQSFLVPAETSSRVWAIGNHTSCRLIGATTQMGFSSLLYSVFLSFYFMMTIRFGVKEQKFARTYEPWLHSFMAGFPFVTSLTGFGLDAYNEVEIGIGCFLKDWPAGCNDNDEVECYSDTLAWASAGWFVVLTFPCLAVMNLIIYFHVRAQMQRGMRRSLHRENQLKRIRQVATQAFLYVFAFSTTYFWTTLLRIIESQDVLTERDLYPFLVIQAVLLPSTGIFNIFIFLRPKYLSVRSQHPETSSWWVFRRALYGESVPIDERPVSNVTNSSINRLESLRSFRNQVVKSFRLNRSTATDFLNRSGASCAVTRDEELSNEIDVVEEESSMNAENDGRSDESSSNDHRIS